MSKVLLFTVLFCLGASGAFGQKRKAAQTASPAKTIAAAAKFKEISNSEWNVLTNALDKEDWERATVLAAAAMGKLNSDNDKKQLARLRYVYVHALSGKAAAGKITYQELGKIAVTLVGKEFLMPSRRFLADCAQRVNYVCPVKTDENAVRATATDKSGTTIHSFEYVKLIDKISSAENDGKQIFLGGTLESAQINVYKSDVRILRLVFDKGFVNIVPN